MRQQTSIGREAAVAMYESKWWEGKTAREVAEFQLVTAELCLPFALFHTAMEEVLGHPIFSHEFGMNYDGLHDELFKGKAPLTADQVFALIPEDKRVLVVLDDPRRFDILDPRGENHREATPSSVMAWLRRRGVPEMTLMGSVKQQMNNLEPGKDFMLPMGGGHVILVRRSM